ncbi:hypothetical protein SGLAM104S_04328 [Streptomyces glaucescens]
MGTGFNQDFNSGVMDRFRSLPIGRGSVLFAKIAVELLRMLVAVAILLVVGVLVGFDITNGAGLLAAVALAAAFGSSLMWVLPPRDPEERAVRAGHGLPGADAAAVRLLGVRPAAVDAGLAPGLHRLQPAVHARRRRRAD